MSTSSYHHGDLRNALLTAAERIIDADVTRSFSLRELARETGVSHAAPYKHFATQADLIAELALRWMTQFVAVQEAAARSAGGPLADLLAAGEAYALWAVDHPSRFTVIFDPAINPGTGRASLGPVAARHEALLRRLVLAAIASGEVSGEPAVVARQLWATVHGLATLVILGHIDRGEVTTVLLSAVASPDREPPSLGQKALSPTEGPLVLQLPPRQRVSRRGR